LYIGLDEDLKDQKEKKKKKKAERKRKRGKKRKGRENGIYLQVYGVMYRLKATI
jgi:hypothetical protein